MNKYLIINLTMDNLKFTVKVTNTDISLYAHALNGTTFTTTLEDLVSLQQPEQMLMNQPCKALVAKNIEDSKYTYNSDEKTVTMRIPLFGDYYVETTLTEIISEPADYKVVIENILARLDKTEPYELIDRLEVPKWNSFAELKLHPDYKYIEAFINKDSYITTINTQKSGNDNYGFINNPNAKYQKLTGQLPDIKKCVFGNKNIIEMKSLYVNMPKQPHEAKCINLIEDYVTCFNTQWHNYPLIEYDAKSSSPKAEINKYIQTYCKMVINGWLLLNYHLLLQYMGHLKVFINIDTTNKNIEILFKRDKTKMIKNKYGLLDRNNARFKWYLIGNENYIPVIDPKYNMYTYVSIDNNPPYSNGFMGWC